MKVGGVCDRRSCSCNTNKQLLTNYHQGHGTESLQSWNNQTGKWANRSWRRNKNRHQSSERTEGKANKSIALVSKLGQTLLKWKINNAIANSFFFQDLIQSKFQTSTDTFHWFPLSQRIFKSLRQVLFCFIGLNPLATDSGEIIDENSSSFWNRYETIQFQICLDLHASRGCGESRLLWRGLESVRLPSRCHISIHNHYHHHQREGVTF